MPKEPSIQLRQEPDTNVCLICGRTKVPLMGWANEVILQRAGARTLHHWPLGPTFEPCDACKELYLKIGTAIFETEDESNCPTGAVLVVTDDAYRRVTGQDPPGCKSTLMPRAEFRKNFQHLSPKEGIAGFLHHNAGGQTSGRHNDNGEEKKS